MDKRPIGIIDSGFGGLSLWKAVASELPHESITYLGDSKNCPYGGRKKEEIYSLAKQLIQFLIKQNVKLVIIACNTITVTCLDQLRGYFPKLPITGIVPVIKTAASNTKNNRIGVLSTVTTANSSYQHTLIDQFAKGIEVVNIGTDKLVPFVESGDIDGKEVQTTLKRVLQPFLEKHVDIIALGCSHFSFLYNAIQQVVGPDVQLIDSAGAMSRQAKRVLEQNNSLQTEVEEEGYTLFYTTGDLKHFSYVARKLLGTSLFEAAGSFRHTNLDKV